MIGELAVHPLRPESEVEWEDLLLRLEIAPRVARNAVEELADVGAASRALVEAVAREREVGRLLEAAAGLPSGGGAGEGGETAAPLDLVHRFASLRARTFAMVQRRGLEVWDWRVRTATGDAEGSVHQLLRWLVDQDGELLARLRAGPSGSPAPC